MPENTLGSLRRAVELGADGVELDVRLSADGIAVVIHDETVDRTTGASGRVDSLSARELGGLDAGGGAGVPTLAEVARWAADTGAWLNVELKEARAAPAALTVVRSAGVLGRVFLSSFHPRALLAVRALAPEAARWLLTEHWTPEADLVRRRLAVSGVCLGDAGASPAVLETLDREETSFVVWTVDDPGRAADLYAAGAAGVITNRPDRVRAPGTG
jgi:glycerophosphoryl diester phosphodiesterase